MNSAVARLLYCVFFPGLNPTCFSAVSPACLFSRFKMMFGVIMLG